MSKCWYCNNELTTGDNPKHFGICNKCYDEMFRSGDTIIRSFTNKISDLEAKLAEKDEQLEYFSKRDDEQEKQLEKQALFHRKSIKELKQQLAQAQKTIEIQKMSNNALQEENLDYRYDITDTTYEQAKEMASGW